MGPNSFQLSPKWQTSKRLDSWKHPIPSSRSNPCVDPQFQENIPYKNFTEVHFEHWMRPPKFQDIELFSPLVHPFPIEFLIDDLMTCFTSHPKRSWGQNLTTVPVPVKFCCFFTVDPILQFGEPTSYEPSWL